MAFLKTTAGAACYASISQLGLSLYCLLCPQFTLADVFKCVNPGGQVIYSDVPCPGKAKVLKLAAQHIDQDNAHRLQNQTQTANATVQSDLNNDRYQQQRIPLDLFHPSNQNTNAPQKPSPPEGYLRSLDAANQAYQNLQNMRDRNR